MNLSFKQQVGIYLGIIVGSILVFFGAIFFLKNSIGSAIDTITADENTIANQNAAVTIFANLKMSVADARRYETAMGKLLATQDDLISFPSTVDSLGRKENINATFSFSGDPVSSTVSTPGRLGFTLAATGPVGNVVVFLKDLEVTAPVLLSEITSFDLSQNGSNYTLSAQGNLFFK
jgi:hypothetical protein